MPASTRREDTFIELFLSVYENYSWADATIDWPDKRTDNAVDALATRKSDGKRLAVEHTIIEPFVGDIADYFAFLDAGFLDLEKDTSLPVPGQWTLVFVPVGTLESQDKEDARAIVQSVHGWIASNRLTLPYGESQHRRAITGTPSWLPSEVPLRVRVVPSPTGPAAESGILRVRREQVKSNLGEVIEKALTKKLPKLVNTPADKRILLLERQHMNLLPQSMLDEIEKRRATFPNLARVDEIWIVETMDYKPDSGSTYLRFELHQNGNVSSFDFESGKLVMRFEGGVSHVIRQDP